MNSSSLNSYIELDLMLRNTQYATNGRDISVLERKSLQRPRRVAKISISSLLCSTLQA